MAGGAQRNGDPIVGINVTPLVDITLVLLIIFIVAARIVATPALPLDLPQATTSESVQVVFSIVMPESGALTVNGEAVKDDADFSKRAKDALASNADLRAVISASGALAHRQVIHVLDLLRAAGVSHIAFGTLADEGKP